MQHILVMGAGKIGSLITFLLANSNRYQVHLGDRAKDALAFRKLTGIKNVTCQTLDATNESELKKYIEAHKIQAVISSLPYFCNTKIATVAAETNIHYFDLTEDVATTQFIQKISQGKKTAFIPQCGLAPGFINIIANDVMKRFDVLDTAKLRVGALPANCSNALQYSLTWSTDGLINEYGNPCQALINGKLHSIMPLEDLEEIEIDGLTYEAFNTSGGLGSLADTYANKIKNLNYKTIRYPGHAAKIKFLMNDLGLNDDRDSLKRILERALPKTDQDVVLVYASATGIIMGEHVERNFVKKFYPSIVNNEHWTEIQLTTASGICTIADIVLNNPSEYHGFIRQEDFSYQDLINNAFGSYFKTPQSEGHTHAGHTCKTQLG